ncbi:cytochrome P450 2D20 [Biomphalaria glabrata]|nr:cytochrome P450 2D20 [Biomphalaria glabrata]
MTNPDHVIAKFYEELNSTILDIPKTEKLRILGDFNARVGSDHHIWKAVLGKFMIGQCNSNGSQFIKDAFTNIHKNVQKQLRQMQDTWLSKKVETIQEFADKHDMKNFYHAINEIYGPTKSGSSPLLNADGTILLTDKEEILKRWAEHFEKVLNTPTQ